MNLPPTTQVRNVFKNLMWCIWLMRRIWNASSRPVVRIIVVAGVGRNLAKTVMDRLAQTAGILWRQSCTCHELRDKASSGYVGAKRAGAVSILALGPEKSDEQNRVAAKIRDGSDPDTDLDCCGPVAPRLMAQWIAQLQRLEEGVRHHELQKEAS